MAPFWWYGYWDAFIVARRLLSFGKLCRGGADCTIMSNVERLAIV